MPAVHFPREPLGDGVGGRDEHDGDLRHRPKLPGELETVALLGQAHIKNRQIRMKRGHFRDLDSDGDGIPDAEEGTGDADSDRVPNYVDTR